MQTTTLCAYLASAEREIRSVRQQEWVRVLAAAAPTAAMTTLCFAAMAVVAAALRAGMGSVGWW